MVEYKKGKTDIYYVLLTDHIQNKSIQIGEIGKYEKDGSYCLLLTSSPTLLSFEQLYNILHKIKGLNEETR